MNKHIVIVGGMGYVGQNLTKSLLQKEYEILIIDNMIPLNIEENKNVIYKKIDLLDKIKMNDTISSFKPIILIHLASMGMSGSAMLSTKCKEVNVDGTSQLINICLENNVPHFIYTSSYNVVFGGNEILNGDESLPYYPTELHTDQYSATKGLAEAIVLLANDKKMKNGKPFMASSIRPAAIYGTDEKRHFPRIIKHMDNGLFIFRIGQALVDWVHIDNLVLSYNLLIDKMLHTSTTTLATTTNNNNNNNNITNPGGQSYFISDGSPIQNFEFLYPLCQARGRKYPSLVLSTTFMLHFAYVLEQLYHLTNHINIPIEPFLTRAEVLKVGISHYFTIDKAKKELNYQPLLNSKEGSLLVGQYYLKNLHNHDYFDYPHIIWWILICYGMIMLTMIVLLDSSSIFLQSFYMKPIKDLAYYLFSTRYNLKLTLVIAIILHMIEAMYAIIIAIELECLNTWLLWSIQTLFLGYPSLQLLLQRKVFINNIKNNKIQLKTL